MKIADFCAIADHACRILDLWSPAAVQLVTMTAVHESHLEFRQQIGGGPALGLCQMEPATHDDIWSNFLAYHDDLAARLRGMLEPGDAGASAMAHNDLYAAGMCRVHYRRAKPPLPAYDDPDGMAGYWKAHYNSALGAGSPESFKTSYLALTIRESWA